MSPGGYQAQPNATRLPVVHRDGDDMTYSPVNDNRTSTQRLDELAAAVLLLTQKVNTLERRLENLQGD